MLKKSWIIFMRDFKVNLRDFLALYLLLIPLIFALGINLLAPSINDTTINLGMIAGENSDQAAYFSQYAKVEVFSNQEDLDARIMRRDDFFGIVAEGGEYYVLKQGNENEGVVDYAKVLLTFYEQDVQLEETNAEIFDLGRTVPPMKKLLVNGGILFISVLGGMMITFNIVEEKVDRTIRAILLTPISRRGFIVGKSMMGVFLTLYGTIAMILITGFGNVNLLQLLTVVLLASIISILVGFIQGVRNDDVINAAANLKLLFLPLVGAIAGAELLSDKWQILLYWIPFYWAYKGNDAVLTQTATWPQIGLYAGIILAISVAVYFLLAPEIKEGLE